MNIDHYTYRVTWSQEDGEHVGLCAEFPSLSWLAATPEKALAGIRHVVAEVVADMQATGESVPDPLSEKNTADVSWFAYLLWSIVRLQLKQQSRGLALTAWSLQSWQPEPGYRFDFMQARKSRP